MSRRIGTLLRDPEIRSAFAYLAVRPHRWSYRRPQAVSRKPAYLSAASKSIPVHLQFEPLLDWGDAPVDRETFDLELASQSLHAASLAALPWKEHFDDLEDEAALQRFAWLLPWLLERHSNGTKRDGVLRLVRAAQMDWIRLHPNPDATEAWQPYTVSERLMNWIIALLALGASLADATASARAQASYLLEHLEYFGDGSTGNHLSNNGRALYAAGLALADGDLMAAGRSILLAEPKRLFEHRAFLREDSSHYQFLVTRNYAEVLWLARAAGDRDMVTELEPLVRDLADACRFFMVRSARGWTIPTIGDLSPDCSPSWLIEPSGWRRLFAWDYGEPSVGTRLEREWVRLDRGRWTVFAHVNRNGAPFQPGHGHNDTGGIVAFLDGEPLLLDTGRRHYMDDAVGRFGRSSAAHSTLLVDRRDAAPESFWLIPPEFLAMRIGARPDLSVESGGFSIRHGGFSRLAGVGLCSRRVVAEDARLTISDVVEGSGRRRVSIIMHLDAPFRSKIDFPQDLITVREFHGSADEDRFGWTSDRYGARRPIRTLIAEAEVQLPWRGVTTCAAS
ncbi:MAG TPA: heparinase II/III family protein [Thermoanaerobaculia bacterium]|nr:heparinase II/III family protein [Thermoanaerobaculia bacterium]